MAGARRAEAKILSATSAQAVAALSATTFSQPTVGVIANGTGSLIGTLKDDSAAVTFAVVEGGLYPLSFKSIDATSAVAIVALFNT